MAKCAVVLEDKVVNIIVAEPTDTPPDNCILVLIPDNVFVNIDFTWDGTNFLDLDGNISLPVEPRPEEPMAEEPTPEEPIVEEIIQEVIE